MPFPPLHRADVEACTFSEWYPRFRKLTIRASVIKPLEQRFIDYLESDRIFVPQGSSNDLEPSRLSDMGDDSDSANGTDSSQDESWQVTFPELDAQIRDIIAKYDGYVFPKLNWSSPQDAAWMLPGSTCRCQSPADIYLLLKSSDFINHDLDHAFEGCVDAEDGPDDGNDSFEAVTQDTLRLALDDNASPLSDRRRVEQATRRKRGHHLELVLKKWYDMPRSQEWRCFVRLGRLVAVCQRDSNYYDFLQGASMQADLLDKIEDFFADEIRGKFPSDNYTFDIYFTKANDRIFIVDFNPWAPRTDSLLFDWAELNALSPSSLPEHPMMRLVTSAAVASQSMPAFSHNRFPKDVIDLSSGASIAEFAERWRTALAEGVKDSAAETPRSSSRESVGR